jgi:GNAT superfamily N-acetyltransferase
LIWSESDDFRKLSMGPKPQEKALRSCNALSNFAIVRAVAVREDMQGKGLGTALVVDAMRRCLGIADQMGAAAIVLDVLMDEHFERRWNFYEELGFQPLGDPANKQRVFIPMANVRATLG